MAADSQSSFIVDNQTAIVARPCTIVASFILQYCSDAGKNIFYFLIFSVKLE